MQLGPTKRSRAIRGFLLNAIRIGKKDPIGDTAEQFAITRDSVSRHVKALIDSGHVAAIGSGPLRELRLGPVRRQVASYDLHRIAEDRVYRSDFEHIVEGLPRNIEEIWYYGFTEILNNAIDHSGGSEVTIVANRDKEWILLSIHDDGEGIFNKISRVLELDDPREAILELSKGKLTTDPQNHTGEGIFFTSRAFDVFMMRSGDLVFSHLDESPSDMMNHVDGTFTGTDVTMLLSPSTDRTLTSVFDQYVDEESFDFSKTVIPLRLAIYEGAQLVSRSQAKRILHRVERFRNVMLDFEGVDAVGRAFADEIFRVFARRHPEVALKAINMNDSVRRTVEHARLH